MKSERPLAVVFFRTETGNEPIRERLKNPHRGSNLRDLLKEDGVLEEVETRAWKRALALQLQRLLEQRELTKSEMATRMKTSRAAVDRLLDQSNPSVTLATLEKAASALGAKLKIELISA